MRCTVTLPQASPTCPLWKQAPGFSSSVYFQTPSFPPRSRLLWSRTDVAGSLSSPLAPSPFTRSVSGPVQNTARGCQHHALILPLSVPPSPSLSGWEQRLAFLVSTPCSCGLTLHVTAKVVQLRAGHLLCQRSPLHRKSRDPCDSWRPPPWPKHLLAVCFSFLEHTVLHFQPQSICSGFCLGISGQSLSFIQHLFSVVPLAAPHCSQVCTHRHTHMHQHDSTCINFYDVYISLLWTDYLWVHYTGCWYMMCSCAEAQLKCKCHVIRNSWVYFLAQLFLLEPYLLYGRQPGAAGRKGDQLQVCGCCPGGFELRYPAFFLLRCYSWTQPTDWLKCSPWLLFSFPLKWF